MPISLAEGLHPSVSDPPPVVRTGGVISLVHLTVRDTDVVFPQPSLAVNVLVLARLHPLLTTGPSDGLRRRTFRRTFYLVEFCFLPEGTHRTSQRRLEAGQNYFTTQRQQRIYSVTRR